MSLDPKKFREYVLQILYANCINSQEIDVKGVMGVLRVSKKTASLLLNYCLQVVRATESLDEKIKILSKEWSFQRISLLEKQILRFGLFELEKKEIENSVVIAEMIRLCKKFSTEASSQYIHAILDASVKDGCEGCVDAQT